MIDVPSAIKSVRQG